MEYWEGKRAVITGASSGLGRAVAEMLAARGAHLMLIARTAETLSNVANTLRARGGSVSTLSADVTQLGDVERIVEATQKELGGVDILCHCAGRSMRGEILVTRPDDHCELWEVNFLAPFQLTQALAESLTESRGHVVFVGSLASKVAPRYMGAYPCSKFPLAALAQQLRLQWGKQGPHVLLVCPGPIARADSSDRYAAESSGVPEDARRAGGGAIVRKIDPTVLAEQILNACERRLPELVVPRKARILFAVTQLWPQLGDWLLRKTTAS
jgi:short-subunit dehydrogenase